MANYQNEGEDPRIADAMRFLRLANEADSVNRSDALDDLRFVSGDQWPVEIRTVETWKPALPDDQQARRLLSADR